MPIRLARFWHALACTTVHFVDKEAIMNKLGLSIVVVTAAVLALAGPAWSDSKEGKKKGKADMAASVKVPIEQAIKAAADKTGGKAIEAELEREHGKIVWEIEVVTAEGKTVEVHVDADSGEVIDVEDKGEKKAEKKKGKGDKAAKKGKKKEKGDD
jgi:hypothetical protein